ncbi:MAG: S8 family serine peptidase, partial [Candidatus Ranarchaeia archaeon]
MRINTPILRSRILASMIISIIFISTFLTLFSNYALLDKSLDNEPSLISSPPADFGLPSHIISASELYDEGFTGQGLVIAVLDTGIDTSHPDLDDLDDNATTDDPKVIGSISFVEGDPTTLDLTGHGTYCASLVAGTGESSDGKFKGIAPKAYLLNVKVMLGEGLGVPAWISSGINWAVDNGADIILLPFSMIGFPGDEVDIAIEEAYRRGVLVIAAAGDRGPNFMTVLSPGGSPAAITVGAYDFIQETVPDFSSRGSTFDLVSKPDVIAPG